MMGIDSHDVVGVDDLFIIYVVMLLVVCSFYLEHLLLLFYLVLVIGLFLVIMSFVESKSKWDC